MVFEPTSSRFLADTGLAQEISRQVGPFVTTVAVFGPILEPLPKGFDLVQGLADPASRYQKPLLQTVRLGSDQAPSTPLSVHQDAVAIILDAFDANVYGGSGKSIDWALAAEFVQGSKLPVILAGGLNPDNVWEAIERVHPYGVDVSSGVESAPGRKDKSKVKDFILAAKS